MENTTLAICDQTQPYPDMVTYNIFLGLVESQNITQANTTNKIVYGSFLVEGGLMVIGNFLLVSVILAYKPLRSRKEMLIIAGLGLGDLLYGMGFFFSGIRRLSLALEGKHMWKVTPWSCMKAIQTPFFIAGSQAAAFMLVILSFDRLLAVKWFRYYMGLTTKYAKFILLVVFSYCLFTVPCSALLSAFCSDPTAKVPAICISTQVGPHWFASYQPTIQMTCGVLSVLIYILTWYYYRQYVQQLSAGVQSTQMKRQRKLTQTVGMTVLVTFICYVLPHSMILFFNTFQASKHLAGIMSPFGWVLGNINSIVNIFIVGLHNRDVKKVLLTWLHCSQPQFSGGHTLSHSATPTPGMSRSSKSPQVERNNGRRYQRHKAINHNLCDPIAKI